MVLKKCKYVKVDKKDYRRALLTDTTPSDVPIIFSNDGLYINSHKVELGGEGCLDKLIKQLYTNIIDFNFNESITEPSRGQKQNEQSLPHKYKIIKNEVQLRTLSLLHPRAQVNFARFYKDHSDSITYMCSLSQFTIRAPQKVGNSFYSYDSDVLSKYKEIDIETLEAELGRKHASSFFSYKGFNRIYKLYSSPLFLNLEKKFSVMWLLDVSNCFDSIYTHTISWAVKYKDFIKNNVNNYNQFCQCFDRLVQRSNSNETNGIPVGAEVSRIFAEIIFQSIDLDIKKELSKKFNLELFKDYSINRYVDDYIIFGSGEDVLQKVAHVISDCLSNYNLYIKETKVQKFQRPFITQKSDIIISLKKELSNLEKTLFKTVSSDKRELRFANKILKRKRFVHSYIDRIKQLCNIGGGYSDVAAYLISVFSRWLAELIESDGYSGECQGDGLGDKLVLKDAVTILFELMFFFYSVHPTINSSNKVAKTIIIVDRFLVKKYPDLVPHIRTVIMADINGLPFDYNKHDSREGYISLERLNIILATSDFGKNYLISPACFDEIINDASSLTYFGIVSFLYYFKEHEEFKHFVQKLETVIINRFSNSFKLERDSEAAHLFLDLLSCPYVSKRFRKELLSRFYEEYLADSRKNWVDIADGVDLLESTYWFVKWKDLDLIKLLERKELKSIY